MSSPKYTSSYGAALNLATFAQPVATAQLLTLDERIDQVRNDLLIAKAENDQATIERLRIVWAAISEEIETEQVVSADLDADSYLPFEPTVCEMREMAAVQGGEYSPPVPNGTPVISSTFASAEVAANVASPHREDLPPLDTRPICNQVRDGSIFRDVGNCDYTVYLSLDCLIAAHEAQDATKAQQSAWEFLSELTSVTMRGNAYRIPSARWANTTYTTTATACTCESRKPCWHMRAAATLDLAREHDAIETAAYAASWA